ncbi:MAG: GntR family transcriptional regulator, partial [Hyphomicrobiales bacterium]|nr:GntR family transcriptional regulator [Hyphomicrobiales bacterium]
MSKSTDKAYAAIYEALTDGRLRPGEHLSEERLAREIGVSRTPVREALRRLSAEGFVEFLPNQGGKVPFLSVDDVIEIFDLRVILESYAASIAASKINLAQLDELGELCGKMEKAVAKRSPTHLEDISASNRRFHRILIEAARGQRLGRILTQVIEMPLMLDTYNRFSVDDMNRSMRHHRELTIALTARDSDWAEAVMRVHIQSAP